MTDVEATQRYDLFISYSKEDVAAASELEAMFRHAGLSVWHAPSGLRDGLGQDGWQDRIFDAIDCSDNFGVYASDKSLTSGWVRDEIRHFRRAQQERGAHRRLLVFRDAAMTEEALEARLRDIPDLSETLRPGSPIEALQLLADSRIKTLTASLGRATDLAREAFQYYRHARFWQPFSAEGQRLHVFTCGRDTQEEVGKRGQGGRTNIDIWDYRTAVDLTHHFARHHRDIGVQIEQPVSKAIIDESTKTYNTTNFSGRLFGQNCVIIGSPDVSDFAEIVLAELVRVEPYQPEIDLYSSRIKFIKSGRSHSTFYSNPGADETEGIRIIDEAGVEHTYENTATKTHGLIILADNPFPWPDSDARRGPAREHDEDSAGDDRRRGPETVLVLAGHTGIATRAMSLLLTDDAPRYLDEFYKLDQQIALMRAEQDDAARSPDPVVAVVEVNYRREPTRASSGNGEVGDNRKIDKSKDMIIFKKAVRLTAT